MTTFLMSKIVSLSDAAAIRRDRAAGYGAPRQDEQRRKFRRESNDRMFIQVVASADDELVGTTISCRAIDVSPNGLKIACNQLIPENCTVDLWVDDSAQPGKFFLASEVRWALDKGAGEFHIGVELIEGAATDLNSWRERQQ